MYVSYIINCYEQVYIQTFVHSKFLIKEPSMCICLSTYHYRNFVFVFYIRIVIGFAKTDQTVTRTDPIYSLTVILIHYSDMPSSYIATYSHIDGQVCFHGGLFAGTVN